MLELYQKTIRSEKCEVFCLQSQSIIIDEKSQAIESYSERKMLAEKIADLYDESETLWEYAAKIRGCGDTIIVRTYEGAVTEIAHALFCRCRLCPMCAWRRSLKAYGQLSEIMTYLDKQRTDAGKQPWAYILITLTAINCQPVDLPETIDHLLDSFARLRRSPEWRKAIHGCHRSLEVTYNPIRGDFHPHLHLLCAVQPSYFTNKIYISQAHLTQLWKAAMKVAYTPVVDIRRCEEGSGNVAEVTKYVTRHDKWLTDELSDWLLTALHVALHGRKLFAHYGIMRDGFRALRLSDEDGDLLDVGESDSKIAREMRADLRYTLEAYTYIPRTGYMAIAPEKLTTTQYGYWSALCQDEHCDTHPDD